MIAAFRQKTEEVEQGIQEEDYMSEGEFQELTQPRAKISKIRS